MLERAPEKSMADLYRELPQTWGTPTMSAHCPDEIKYTVADKVKAKLEALRTSGGSEAVAGHDHTARTHTTTVMTSFGRTSIEKAPRAQYSARE